MPSRSTEVVAGHLVQLDVDAIVNAANPRVVFVVRDAEGKAVYDRAFGAA
ncbi:MAG: hypothetical protein ACHQ7M_04805 [Chloroflexota bacterium]